MKTVGWHILYVLAIAVLLGFNMWIYHEYRMAYALVGKMTSEVRAYKSSVDVANASITFLAQSASSSCKYEGWDIGNYVIEDEKGEEYHIADVLDAKRPKVVVFFSAQNCKSCVANMFQAINDYDWDVSGKEMIVIGEFANKRAAKAYVSRIKMPFALYYKNEANPVDILENESSPFACVMYSDLIAHDVIFPVKEIPLYTRLYMKVIEDKYFK